jgi:hypothetical protein
MSITDFRAKLAHAPIPSWVVRAASWALAGYSFVCGWDYLHTPAEAPGAKSLRMVVRLATIHTWGIWFTIAGAVLTLGLLFGRHAVVWLGHVLGAVLYIGFAAATFQAVWKYEASPLSATGGDIWRAVYLAFMVAVGHVAICYVMGPIPRRGDEQ